MNTNRTTMKVFIVATLAVVMTMIVITTAGARFNSTSINPNLKYYGYDWLDGRQVDVQTAFNNISATGPANTNMNVVHTIDNLNSPVCANRRCALSIGAGTSYPNTWLDICPLSKDSDECISKGSWSNIWTIVASIKTAKNIPIAIYFIDEPSFQKGLRISDHYVTWQYASYVCTLRQALAANNLSINIFTILAPTELGSDSTPYNITNEIRHQMPSTGCPASVKSTPDWIGIDNYEWQHVVGGRDDSAAIHSTYSTYFPAGETMPKWVLVPPATQDLGYTDVQLHDRIQVYWDYLYQFPTDPVIAIMNFRFDDKVMTVPVGVDPNNHNDPRNIYWRSRDLLKFMGNMLTP